MMSVKIKAKKPIEWSEHPVVKELKTEQPMLWFNPFRETGSLEVNECDPFVEADLDDAAQRLERFKPFFMKAFPETALQEGLVESPLVAVPKFQEKMMSQYKEFPKKMWVKCDSLLPISGSIKARGGFYEVLKHAEDLALRENKVQLHDDYSIFASDHMKQFFSQFTIAVGSTGNLGLSIGIMSAVLGFTVKVHMSSDAKAWKKDMLRAYGTLVYEYEQDYSAAVEAGRALSDADPNSYFVDDEHSKDLFMGYTVAARRLKKQLEQNQIEVNAETPLYVYLPCGVGGGPGGVAYGLKKIFGDNVHCYFAEPIQSPCMLLGISTQTHESLCVQDFGLTNKTLADGLAVGRASGLVSRIMTPLLEGLYTVSDTQLIEWLRAMYQTEHLKLEPSALAGVGGPVLLSSSETYRAFMIESQLLEGYKNANHIIWATGGSMVPDNDFKNWLGIK